MIEHLYRALACEYGLKLPTNDPQRLIQRLHKARREAQDEQLSSLIIAVSRTDPQGEVWIVQKPKESGDSNAQEV